MKQSQAKVLLKKPTVQKIDFLLDEMYMKEQEKHNEILITGVETFRDFQTLHRYNGIIEGVKVIYALRKNFADDSYTLVFQLNKNRFYFESVYYGNVFQYIRSSETVRWTIIGLLTKTIKPGNV